MIHPDQAIYPLNTRLALAAVASAPFQTQIVGSQDNPTWVGDFTTLQIFLYNNPGPGPCAVVIQWFDTNNAQLLTALGQQFFHVGVGGTLKANIPIRVPWVAVYVAAPAACTVAIECRLNNLTDQPLTDYDNEVQPSLGLLATTAAEGVLIGAGGSQSFETIATYVGRCHLWVYGPGACAVQLRGQDYYSNDLGIISQTTIPGGSAGPATDVNIDVALPPTRVIAKLINTFSSAATMYATLVPAP